jgi:ribose/xylose/arabinose/galactoside ABC-type transport system permease subunit
LTEAYAADTDRARTGGQWATVSRVFALRNAGVVYALILLVATFTIFTAATGRPSYLQGVNVANVVDQSSFVGIQAVFMTIVLISGNFDLSVAAAAALAGAAGLAVVSDIGIPGGIALSLAIGATIGLANGSLVQFAGVNAFIVTLGAMVMLRGLFLVATNGESVFVSDIEAVDRFRKFSDSHWVVPHVLAIVGGLALLRAILHGRRKRHRRSRGWLVRQELWLGAGGIVLVALSAFIDDSVSLTASAWYFLIIGAVAWFVLTKTIVGRRLYAVGGNPEAARLAGISVHRYRIGAFVLSGAAAGFVGALYAARNGTVAPVAMTGQELTVIAAAILGGVSLFGGSGSIAKAMIGTLILFTINNGFNILNLGANYQQVIQGGIIIASAAIYTVTLRRERRLKPGEHGSRLHEPVATPATPQPTSET